MMSNHHHILLTDVRGELPNFMMTLNSLVARAMNALLGTRGTVFEKDYSAVEVTTRAAAIERAVYTLANPAKGHLVKRCTQWPGFSTRKMAYGESEAVARPSEGMWGKPEARRRRRRRSPGREKHAGKPSTMPAMVHLKLSPPFSDEDRDEDLRTQIIRRLREREAELMVERSEKGIRVMGARRVCLQKWHECPGSSEDWFGTKPTVSGRCRWKRMEALQRKAAFRGDYAEARRRYSAGERDVVWPRGTWLMVQRHNVSVAPAPS